MAQFATSNPNSCGGNLNSKQQITDRRFRGTVKFYKSSGYGFLKVPDFDDVFFHIKDLLKCGIDSPEAGDVFFFRVVPKNRGPGMPPGYQACSFEVCMRKSKGIAGTQNKELCDVRDKFKESSTGNSGSFISNSNSAGCHHHQRNRLEFMPHAKDVPKNVVSGTTNMQPKPIKITPNVVKIGPVCNVPVKREHSLVSATHSSSTQMIPPDESEEVKGLQALIEKKKITLKSLRLDKLPDGGRRLKDDISALELKLKELRIKGTDLKSNDSGSKENKPPLKSKTGLPQHPSSAVEAGKPYRSGINETLEKKMVQTKIQFPKTESMGTTIAEEFDAHKMNPMHFPDGPLYGGRMTSSRLTEVREITKAAIEDLHSSLKTMPEASAEMDDPSGLKVTLMPHQRQALAWLVWRECQAMSGGILADDMGLGKTLTMISLIIKQKEIEDVEKTPNEEDDIQDFNSSSDSQDSDVILIKDDEKGGKLSISEKACEQLTETEKSSLVESEATLIIAPASLLFHWEKEIRNRSERGLLSIHLFHGASREKDAMRLAEFDVVITTYDIVRRCGSVKEDDKQGRTLMLIKWRRVILDEAHQVKNFKSQSSESVCKLEARSRWALSGTPVQNNLTDMYAVLKYLHCRPFDEYKLWKHHVDNNTRNGKERLKTLISCIVLRREKGISTPSGKPIVDLPERTFITHKLKLNDVEKEVYDKLQSDSKAAFRKFEEKKGSKSVTATTLLVMLLRMRQCCGHLNLLQGSFDPEVLSIEKKEFSLVDMFQSMNMSETVMMADVVASDYVEKNKTKYFEKHSTSGKIKFVLEELNKLRFEQPEDKCVIVSQWTSMLEVVAYHLEKANFSYSIIKGSVSAKKRMDIVDEFNRNPALPKVILLSLQAGGVGLNLIGGNHLFLLDMHWNPALESQACDRVYRVGQKKPVFIHKFVMVDTVEERILKLQQYKLELAKLALQGAGSENCKKLTLQDMKLLFGI